MSLESYEHLVKVVFLGPSGVGKSALFAKTQNQSFLEEHDQAISLNFGKRIVEVEGKKIKLQIWDIPGQEKFRSITNSYYRDAQVACIMWDASTFSAEELRGWFNEVKLGVLDNAQFIFVLTKIDLDEEKEITSEMVQEQQAQIKGFAGDSAIFFETSAKTGEGVEKFLQKVAETAYAVLNAQGLQPSIDDRLNFGEVNTADFVPVTRGRFERMSHSRAVRETHLEEENLDPLLLKLHLASVENNCRTAQTIRNKLGEQEHQLTQQEKEKYKVVIELLKELDSDERALKYKLCIFFTFESYSTRVVFERDQQVRQEILNMAVKMYNLIKNNQGDVFMPARGDVYGAEKETLPVVRNILEKAYPNLRPIHSLGK
ncbi:MAG: Rab family GTPase [Gammaproteobacteria bacterium]|nr:Rab family GTPase [Gammaproteobacteria bacterium]